MTTIIKKQTILKAPINKQVNTSVADIRVGVQNIYVKTPANQEEKLTKANSKMAKGQMTKKETQRK